MKHIKALLVLYLHFLLLLLGTPALDFQRPSDFDSTEEIDAVRDQVGEPWTSLLLWTVAFNRDVRGPVYELFADVQRPFRIRQSWHLYRDGPKRVRRLEIRVDGTLVHRSSDDAYAWREQQLRNRRLRPVAEAVAGKTGSPNWRGLVRWIVQEARLDFPEAQEVTVTATEARFPGTDATVDHSYVARAPDWVPREREGG